MQDSILISKQEKKTLEDVNIFKKIVLLNGELWFVETKNEESKRIKLFVPELTDKLIKVENLENDVNIKLSKLLEYEILDYIYINKAEIDNQNSIKDKIQNAKYWINFIGYPVKIASLFCVVYTTFAITNNYTLNVISVALYLYVENKYELKNNLKNKILSYENGKWWKKINLSSSKTTQYSEVKQGDLKI